MLYTISSSPTQETCISCNELKGSIQLKGSKNCRTVEGSVLWQILLLNRQRFPGTASLANRTTTAIHD